MNNKDLFNAINDIDEKFIEDAAKYLNDDDGDDPLHPKGVEIFPGEARFPVIRLVASIAAAAVFITGVTFAVKHYRDKLGVSPNAASETEQNPDLGTHPVKTEVGPLPFELIGPDDKQLWYEDITGFNTKESIAVTDTANVIELSEDNWSTITCNFAYFALPSGNNYNSVENSDVDDLGKPGFIMAHDFRRMYVGNTYGDGLTVTKAYSKLKRDTYYDKQTNLPHEVSYLSESYIEFDGAITAEVYLVNAGDNNYCCIFRNGADYFPIVEYNVSHFLETGEYASGISTLNRNGFKYSGEMPVMWLAEDEEALVKPYLSNANYLKAAVVFTNVTLVCTQQIEGASFDINADISKIVLNYVEPVVTDDNLSGETPFTGDTELRIREMLGCAKDISELKNNAEVMNLTNTKDIRVYRGIANMAGEFGEEILEGSIAPGMVIVLCGSDGEQIAAYKCREAEIPY